jgi:outer membrane protein TolC
MEADYDIVDALEEEMELAADEAAAARATLAALCGVDPDAPGAPWPRRAPPAGSPGREAWGRAAADLRHAQVCYRHAAAEIEELRAYED